SRCSRRSSCWAARSGWSVSRASPTICRAPAIRAPGSSVSGTSSAGSYRIFGRKSFARRRSSPEPAPRGNKKGPPRWWPFGARASRSLAGGDGLRQLREHLERLLAQLLVVVEAGPGGDQFADDHVLLQATQPVDLAGDGGFGQHPGCLLEGRGRQPARRVQGGLDQAEQHRLRHRGIAALGQHLGVGLLVLPLRDDLAGQQVGVAGGVDANLPHHLPDDHLDVLVVDVDALRAIDLLDLVDQVVLHRLTTKDVQQLLGAVRALGDLVTGLDLLAALDVDPRAMGNRVVARLLVHAADDDLVALDAGDAGCTRADQALLPVLALAAGNFLAFRHGGAGFDHRLHLPGQDVWNVVDVA